MKKAVTIFFILILLTGFKVNNSYSETNNVLLEYCTGAWCQWCPCGHDIIHDILINYPNTVVLGYHGYTAANDPWYSYSADIRTIFGFSSYPTGVVGRKSNIVDRGAWNNEVVLQSLLIQPGVSISVTSKSYDIATRTLSATVTITALTDLNADFNINYVLTENNLVYPQTGNGTCAGSTNYVHGHVVKSMMNGSLGEPIHSGTWNTGQIVTKTINYVLPDAPQVANPDNCELNIFVYKQGTNIALNSDVQQAMKTPVTGTTGIINNKSAIPSEYTLSQNYPNPFNPNTHFTFSIPKNENVSLKFYDVLGNEIAVYVDGFMNAGSYSVEFDGSNFSSGIYFYKLTAGGFTETKRMNLIK
ncbi:MAG: Omp28-related outer membrane protein [Ignavibacteria bacterium]